jgi:hypothetical protein
MNNPEHRRIFWEQGNGENYISGGFTMYEKFVTVAEQRSRNVKVCFGTSEGSHWGTRMIILKVGFY